MLRFWTFCALALPFPALAEAFDRPIPQAQSATAEYWFAGASILLIAALVVVSRVISKR